MSSTFFVLSISSITVCRKNASKIEQHLEHLDIGVHGVVGLSDMLCLQLPQETWLMSALLGTLLSCMYLTGPFGLLVHAQISFTNS